MRALHTPDEVRAAEQRLMATLPDGALMQRAAGGLARRCALLLADGPGVYGARVVLLVGAGNNGADALWAGARLARRGARVHAVTVKEPVEDAAAGLRSAGGRTLAHDDPAVADVLAGADLLVDGLTGIGASGALRQPAASLLRRLPSDVPVVAVDVPSGVDAATGKVPGEAVQADLTVTFGCLKPGLVLGAGVEHAGLVELVDIGLEPYLPEATAQVPSADDVAGLLPVPHGESSKYTRGVLGVVAGSDTYTGAAVLAAGAAARAGAGMVRFVCTAGPAAAVRARWPEVVVTEVEPGDGGAVLGAGRVQAWAVGPGMGTDAAAHAVLAAVLGTDVAVLVDADGLTLCAGDPDLLRGRRAPTLVTPHLAEFTRLFGGDADEVAADRLGHARRAACEWGVTVLLKGSATVVADPDGQAWVNPTGTAWLGTAGSGDVLTGGCGALLAGGLSPLQAGGCGAFLHGLAGHLAAGSSPGPIIAEDVLAHWAAAVRTVGR